MKRTLQILTLILVMIPWHGSMAQDSGTTDSPGDPTDINGTWITQSGNLVELEVTGAEVSMYFPAYARYKSATFNGSTLVYITHYNDPTREEVYLDCPDNMRHHFEGYVGVGEPRHRFTLNLSEDGMVLAGVKEINVLHCDWDTDENGNTSNYRSGGFIWQYHSDYNWRRANCDFANLPSINGNVIEKYELIGILLDRFGIAAEFQLGDFDHLNRIKFNYSQAYLDADTGEFVPQDQSAEHPHIEPLDGRVYLDSETGEYIIDLYPYALRSNINLLSGLSIMAHQLQALVNDGTGLTQPTTQMELDSVNYAWMHRQALCAIDDEVFDHHIDFLSRALQYRAMAED